MFCYFVSVKLMSSRLTNVFSVFCALSISGTMLKNMAHFQNSYLDFLDDIGKIKSNIIFFPTFCFL